MKDQIRPHFADLKDVWFQGLSRHVIRGIFLVWFAAAILVFITILLVDLRSLRNVYDSSEAVTNAYSVKAALEQVLTTMLGAETGESEFIITGIKSYRESYDHARTRIASDIAKVRALTADNREHQVDLDRLTAVAELSMRELGEIIHQRQESGLSAAERQAATTIPKKHMDEMRAIVARMAAREDALLTLRSARAEQSYSRARLTSWASTGLGLLVVTALFVATWRSGKDRMRAASAAERLRVTLSSIGDAVIATDDHGRVTGMNEVAESLTGWKTTDATGRPFEEVFVTFNEESRLGVENPIGRVLREGAIAGLANHSVLRSKDGREIPVDDCAAPIRSADGRMSGVVLVFRDVTAQRQIERDRAALMNAEREAKRLAEEASRAKDEFLAMLSHELRTPLSSILGWSMMLRSGQLAVEQADHALGVIERNTRLEVQLVESLLDLSRITAGKLKLEMEQVDLSAIVSAVVESLRPQADNKGVHLTLDVPPNPVAAIGDTGRLQQIFSNLLTNAIKFTGPQGHINIRLTREESQALVHVMDDGEGIPADLIPHIFDRFRQAEGAEGRAYGGLGLGLAIVRELTQAHGGTVSANSAGKGQGSTFTVALPIPAVIPAYIEAKTHKGPPDEGRSISKLRVLVVDGDADARELVALTLEARGAIVRTAGTAQEALKLICNDELDVLVADIAMPEEDGYKLIQNVRAFEHQHSKKRLPAIALSAYASTADRNQASAAGFDLHLSKPVDPNMLAMALARCGRPDDRAA
jgi:PAS domain S-box-containing protein